MSLITINGTVLTEKKSKLIKQRPPEHGYLCYFININEEINSDIYFNNMNKIIYHKETPGCFLETDYLTKLSLRQFATDFNEQGISYLRTEDIYGNKIILKGRDCSILYEAFNENIFNIDLINQSVTKASRQRQIKISTNLISKK